MNTNLTPSNTMDNSIGQVVPFNDPYQEPTDLITAQAGGGQEGQKTPDDVFSGEEFKECVCGNPIEICEDCEGTQLNEDGEECGCDPTPSLCEDCEDDDGYDTSCIICERDLTDSISGERTSMEYITCTECGRVCCSSHEGIGDDAVCPVCNNSPFEFSADTRKESAETILKTLKKVKKQGGGSSSEEAIKNLMDAYIDAGLTCYGGSLDSWNLHAWDEVASDKDTLNKVARAYKSNESMSFNADSKFKQPYDGSHGFNPKRDTKGRYRRKLVVPLKKDAEETLDTLIVLRQKAAKEEGLEDWKNDSNAGMLSGEIQERIWKHTDFGAESDYGLVGPPAEESYDDLLDEMGESAISNYSVSWLLQQADPIAYEVGLNDYESFMLSEHEDDASMYSEWFDKDGDLTRKGEQEIPAIYDESLDEMGTEWLANKYNASWLLKRGDPIAYGVGLSDYESSMEEDWEYHVYVVDDASFGDMYILDSARDFETKEKAIKAAHEVSKDERGKSKTVYVVAEDRENDYEEVIYEINEEGDVLAAEEFGAEEPVVQEPDWIPAGDGRAIGQQNLDINLSPLHAEGNLKDYNPITLVILGIIGGLGVALGAQSLVK